MGGRDLGRRLLAGLAAMTLLAGCGAGASPTPQSGSPISASPGSPSPPGNLSVHGAPALEGLLPASVAGHPLSLFSWAGPDWIEEILSDEGVDAVLAEFATPESGPIDPSHLAAAAGLDPPYAVYAATRPLAVSEADLATFLLILGAGYKDPVRIDLSMYAPRTMAGRVVFVGSESMVNQDEGHRGKPYLYQTDTTMYIVLTDDDAWAEDAISQLPCCWGD